MMGVYKIENLINGKMYIGISVDIERRKYEHFSPTRISKYKNGIYQAMRKYGNQSFSMSVIEEVFDKSKLSDREIFWVNKLKPRYNMTSGGVGVSGLSCSEETKAKISKKAKEQWASMSDEQKSRIIKNNLTARGCAHLTEQQKNHLRKINTGKKQSEETIRKRAEKLRVLCIGNENGNKPVCSYLHGVKQAEYKSVKQAAENVGIHPSGITKVLKGEQKTAGGFDWKLKQQQ